MDTLQISCIHLLQPILGDFYSFATTGAISDYIEKPLATMLYGGMPVLDTGFILKYDFTQSKLSQ